MVTFVFRDFGEDLGTRQQGQQARELLMPLLQRNERVVLDFTGVNVVSNSFADECIAKLLLEMSLAELKAHTTFRGLNPLASKSVLTALQRRHMSLK
ncbi:MAG: STAS-like domain-containing protein [Bacteroidales bacterium]|nr:STAS-like domain-containing protein [Bacteroidales bacterium]